MRTFLQPFFGLEKPTPEKQLQRIRELMGLKETETDLLDFTIKCPKGLDEVSIRVLLKENKEFLLQALNKEKKELEGEAKKELEHIKDLMRRVEEL